MPISETFSRKTNPFACCRTGQTDHVFLQTRYIYLLFINKNQPVAYRSQERDIILFGAPFSLCHRGGLLFKPRNNVKRRLIDPYHDFA